MKEIDSIVKDILKPILKSYSPVILIVKRNWANLMGEKYYEFCEPEKATFKKGKKNDGTLYIKCFNNVISFYIENNKLFILEKINSIFGYNLIGDIRIKQEPKIIKRYGKKSSVLDEENSSKIFDITKDIESEELKNSLKDFGTILFLEKDNSNN